MTKRSEFTVKIAVGVLFRVFPQSLKKPYGLIPRGWERRTDKVLGRGQKDNIKVREKDIFLKGGIIVNAKKERNVKAKLKSK